MNKKWLALALPIALLVVSGCGQDQKVADVKNEKITVSAAASLTNALDEIKGDFIKEKGLKEDQITMNYAGSGTLREQIEQGAPSSIFISANEKHMKMLEDKDMMTDVKPYVTNSLVLIVPKGGEKYTFENLGTAQKISIGTPETVPAGRYAQETLQYFKLWEPLMDEHKLVFAKDVRAVLAQVAAKTVSAGLVYKTDAMKGADKVDIVATAPADSHKKILYPAGIVKKNENGLTKEFYQYIYSPKAKQVLEKYGFTPAQAK